MVNGIWLFLETGGPFKRAPNMVCMCVYGGCVMGSLVFGIPFKRAPNMVCIYMYVYKVYDRECTVYGIWLFLETGGPEKVQFRAPLKLVWG